jgi:GxxExxY protein
MEQSEKPYIDLTAQIIGAAIEVHNNLGPGLLESVYQRCLYYELKNLNLNCLIEHGLPLMYKGMELDYSYRLDLLVNKQVIIEIKTVESLNKLHEAQMLSYLRLSKVKVGLLINFNVKKLKDGIRRYIL